MSDDIVREFLVESNENLDSLDRELVVLEKDPLNKETLSSVFRTIHTIKGTCGFLGFTKLESVAHAGENLLSKMRDGTLTLNPEITTALLQMVDAIRQMLDSIDATGGEGQRKDAALIEFLTALLSGSPPPVPHAAPAARVPEPAPPPPPPPPESVPSMGEILIQKGVATSADVENAMRIQNEGDPRRLGEILVESGKVKPQEIVEALQTQQVARATASEASIRVDVLLLDKVMNLVGELVLARNQIQQFAGSIQHSGLSASSMRLSLITTELQEGVMKTRMQPIGGIWSKFPRTVRDVATSCGKKVRIEMEGQDTELDKTIIEAIKDPLTHLVRNSVDHGIETPEKRAAKGKQPEGILRLRAYHEGGQVNIEITDDGAGLDGERIRKKALERGLISAEQAVQMSDREAVNLIFAPGFSTAEKVTNVSGRGVGMDVVKTNIERIGGTVDVQTKPGLGTTVRMKIPLTLAIIPALTVTCGGDRYAIPQINLLELVRLKQRSQASVQKSGGAIEYVHGAPVYRLRGRLLPLVCLAQILGLEPALHLNAASPPAKEGTITNIVVVQAEERIFGLLVDDVNDTEEIVVKPLGEHLKSVNVFAGATIMGDGSVALILDLRGIAQSANLLGETRQEAHAQSEAEHASAIVEDATQSLLLVRLLGGGQAAIPLSFVQRLEEFPATSLEQVGHQPVIQYREMSLPLLPLDGYLAERRSKARRARTAPPPKLTDTLSVVVHGQPSQQIGLLVERILDVVQEPGKPRGQASRRGVLGTQIIRNQVTEILDVELVLSASILAAPGAVSGVRDAVAMESSP
jgi:two-component system chemotaxis sensor kinase CheA